MNPIHILLICCLHEVQSVTILPSTPVFPNYSFFPWDIPTKTYEILMSPMNATCPLPLIRLDLITIIIFAEEIWFHPLLVIFFVLCSHDLLFSHLRTWQLDFRDDLIYCTCVYIRVFANTTSWEARVVSCCPDNTGSIHCFGCSWPFQQCTACWLEVGGLCHTAPYCFFILLLLHGSVLACEYIYIFAWWFQHGF